MREIVGATLCVIYSNQRVFTKFKKTFKEDENSSQLENTLLLLDSIKKSTNKKEETDTNLTETVQLFIGVSVKNLVI